uniref:C-type lectin domain-containing protein n=1 Tax=Setaria digitata TaxID=48799 RepID=A0A915PC32_9BILA
MVSLKIILAKYFFLLILDLVPFWYTATNVSSAANINNNHYNAGHLSNANEIECPRDWIRYERTKSCFHVIKRRMRWSEAEGACVNYGGHLASIIDEYENMFAFNLAKQANLSIPTLWLGRLVKLTRTGAYEWNDGTLGRHVDGFRELPSGTDLCLTMWLDFDRPEGSWNEWDCNYASGYSALCKRSLKSAPITTTAKAIIHSGTDSTLSYHSHRCCLLLSACYSINHSCTSQERCIPDDLDCWTRSCPSGGIGWCLPISKNVQLIP